MIKVVDNQGQDPWVTRQESKPASKNSGGIKLQSSVLHEHTDTLVQIYRHPSPKSIAAFSSFPSQAAMAAEKRIEHFLKIST